MRRLPGIATLPEDRETPDLRCEKPAPPPASPFMTVHSNTFLVFGCAQIVALVEACATPLPSAAAPRVSDARERSSFVCKSCTDLV